MNPKDVCDILGLEWGKATTEDVIGKILQRILDLELLVRPGNK